MKKIDNSMDLFTFTEHNDELIKKKKKKNKTDDLELYSEFLNADIDLTRKETKKSVDEILRLARLAADKYDKMIEEYFSGEQNGSHITEIGRDEYNQSKSVQDINKPHGRRGVNGEPINNDNRQPNRTSDTELNGKTISNSKGISNALPSGLGFKERIGILLNKELTKRN